MVRRFTVAIDEDASERLTALAHAERRDPREQAGLLLTRVLARSIRQAEVREAPGQAGTVVPSPAAATTDSAAP